MNNIDHKVYRARTNKELHVINNSYRKLCSKYSIDSMSVIGDNTLFCRSAINCRGCQGYWHVKKNITIEQIKQFFHNLDQITSLKLLK